MQAISCLVLASLAIGALAQEFTGYERVPGNCPGSKLAEYPDLPFADCAKRCSENAKCLGFTIPTLHTSSGLCILKSSECTRPETNPDFVFHSKKQALFGAAFVDDVVPWYPPAAYGVPPPSYAGYYYGGIAGFTRANGNCQGNFLSGVLALPIDQCAANCLATAGCAGFSFNFHAAYPQCILKAASCAYPDPGAVFTYFARAAPAPPAYPPAPYYPPYYPDVYVPDYPSYPIYTPWVKSARKFFTYSNELCSGAIKKSVDLDIEKCADACLADSECHGFSFDNHAASAPFTCILRAEACIKRENSTRWSYFERQPAEKFDLDVKYLEDLENGKQQEKQAAEAANKPTSFFDLQRFFAQRPNAQAHHVVQGGQDEIKRI